MDQEKENNEGIDLSGEVKDSDKGVKFQNGEWQRPTQIFFPGTPKIIQWVVKYSGGLIKDERQANYVIFGFVVLAIILSLFFIFSGGSSKSEKPGIETFKNAPSEMIPQNNNR